MTSEIQKKFEFEKTKNPNFATTVDAVRLLKKAVDQDLMKDIIYLLIEKVNPSQETTTKQWSFNKNATENQKISVSNHFIKKLIVKSKEEGFVANNYLFVLKIAVNLNDSDLGAFLINLGIDPRKTDDVNWSFIQAPSEYKEKTSKILALIRYRQFISRRHGDKIAASLIVKTDGGIAPSSYFELDLTDSDQNPNDVGSEKAIQKLSKTLKEIEKRPIYKDIWPIVKLVGLAVQGLHRDTLLTQKSYADHRLLIYIDPEKATLADFDLEMIGTPSEHSALGRHGYYQKQILLGGNVSSDELQSTFIHEATHFAISEAYNGPSMPYAINIKNMEEIKNATEAFNTTYIKPLMEINIKKIPGKHLKDYINSYKNKSNILQNKEIFSYFVEAIFDAEINLDKILKDINNPLHNIAKYYKESIFNFAIFHYRTLCREAMKKRAEILNISPLNENQNNLSSTFLSIEPDTLEYFDDSDKRSYVANVHAASEESNGIYLRKTKLFSIWERSSSISSSAELASIKLKK